MTTPQDKTSFAEWLNTRRDQSVSEAFHDICIAVAEEVKSALLQAKPAEAGRVPLTDEQIEQGRRETFSTENPFCPCTDKTMRKAVRWAERHHGILPKEQP